METKKTPKMAFGKKAFGMPADIRSCCSSFMSEMEQFESCCGMAEMMSKAGFECGASTDQDESGSETKEGSENN